MFTLVDRGDKGSSNAFCMFSACPDFLYFVVCIQFPSLDFDTDNQTVGSPGNEDVNVCTCLCGNDTRKHKISVYTNFLIRKWHSYSIYGAY